MDRPIIGLRRWKTVPSAVFRGVDYQPLEGEMDVSSADVSARSPGLHDCSGGNGCIMSSVAPAMWTLRSAVI